MEKYAYASVIGNSHTIKNIKNQDSIKVIDKTKYFISSIADGHGSNICFRSDIGSSFAVESANIIIERQVALLNKENIDKEKITIEITNEWYKRVKKHLENNPIKDEDIKDFNKLELKKIEKNDLLIYGSTLMSLIITKNYIHVLNIGDGELLLKKKGEVKTESLNKSVNRIGNDTESLSLKNSHKYFNYMSMDKESVNAILMTTDGYPNSFKNERGFIKVIDDLIDIEKEHGMFIIEKNLSFWLEDTTKHGSGDDITVCFIIL